MLLYGRVLLLVTLKLWMTSSTAELRLFILIYFLPPINEAKPRRMKQHHRSRVNMEHEVATVASPHCTYDSKVDVKSRPVHRDDTYTARCDDAGVRRSFRTTATATPYPLVSTISASGCLIVVASYLADAW
jgi:hypothetical protein